MVDFNKPIPNVEIVLDKQWFSINANESLVPISPSGINVYSQYYNQGIPGSYNDCYVRETLLKMLQKVQQSLPEGYYLKVWDGYRPTSIHQMLWKYHSREARMSKGYLNAEKIDKYLNDFIGRPTYNPKLPEPHNTGGSVDVTLMNKDGVVYAMGSDYNVFDEDVITNYYESNSISEEDEFIRDNRRILYNTMVAAGFVNNPMKWWEYDYGTLRWASYNKTYSLYNGISDAKLV